MAKKQFKPPKTETNVEEFIGGGASTPLATKVNKVGRPSTATEPTKKLNCLLPESLFKKLKVDAVNDDTTMTDIVIDLLNNKYN